MTPDTTGDLIGAVAGHMMGAPDEWTSFAMVLTIGGGRVAPDTLDAVEQNLRPHLG